MRKLFYTLKAAELLKERFKRDLPYPVNSRYFKSMLWVKNLHINQLIKCQKWTLNEDLKIDKEIDIPWLKGKREEPQGTHGKKEESWYYVRKRGPTVYTWSLLLPSPVSMPALQPSKTSGVIDPERFIPVPVIRIGCQNANNNGLNVYCFMPMFSVNLCSQNVLPTSFQWLLPKI